ncbi:MAG: ribonuclease D [Actinobacteria bacterium]|nr:ribonuclease D [Actinomycetota bacterium]
MQTLSAPAGGTPSVIETQVALRDAIEQLAAGDGPVAIDAERASGFRYSARAYLIQLFRRGGGLHLIDPIALRGAAEVEELDALLSGIESVIHASSQDLECLREFGINPKILFDTELGARIAGCERVGLASLCENLLEIQIAKEHSAVDWSHRPLKPEWLDYAALDVAVLLDLRDKVEALLLENGKLDWAKEEFAASLQNTAPKVRKDPWRRTSGMHQIKSRFELAIIRELWIARDSIASEIDLAPGRLLSDAVIVDLAKHKPSNYEDFLALPIMKEKIRNDVQRSYLKRWWTLLSDAYEMDQSHWPEMRARGDSIPPPRVWRDKFPIAYIHLAHARLLLTEKSLALNIPLENLISPELVRKVLFNEGKEKIVTYGEDSIRGVSNALAKLGARKWQIEIASDAIARARAEREAPAAPAPEE